MILLPTGELFSFVKLYDNDATLTIDSDYRIRVNSFFCGVLAICYKNSIYCFGGADQKAGNSLCSRLDLDKNRFMKLSPWLWTYDKCNGVVFNGNILISRSGHENLLLYSIDIDSFTTIPYKFSKQGSKVLINTEERLHMIEGKKGKIYESEVGDEYSWKVVGKSIIPYKYFESYWRYNNGGIYIVCLTMKKEI